MTAASEDDTDKGRGSDRTGAIVGGGRGLVTAGPRSGAPPRPPRESGAVIQWGAAR
jgi:hypothetical protein